MARRVVGIPCRVAALAVAVGVAFAGCATATVETADGGKVTVRADFEDLRISPSGEIAILGARDSGRMIAGDAAAALGTIGNAAVKAATISTVADTSLDALGILTGEGAP